MATKRQTKTIISSVAGPPETTVLKQTPRIGNAHEAPSFMVTNKYIVRGYRLHHYTYTDAIASLFTLHNESVNVWSHVLGAGLFIGLAVFILAFKQETITNPLQAFAGFFNLSKELESDGILDQSLSKCKWF
jgi:hypothetical protein